MFLTTLIHDESTWTVELTVIPREEGPGMLEFSFSRTTPEGTAERAVWVVSSDSLEALAEDGVEISEELLREQLSLTRSEERTVQVARGPA